MDSPMSMRVYGFWRSLASFRVRVALKIKGIQFDEIPIDILHGEQFKHEYAEINAERVVPTLVHEDYSIFQSLASSLFQKCGVRGGIRKSPSRRQAGGRLASSNPRFLTSSAYRPPSPA